MKWLLSGYQSENFLGVIWLLICVLKTSPNFLNVLFFSLIFFWKIFSLPKMGHFGYLGYLTPSCRFWPNIPDSQNGPSSREKNIFRTDIQIATTSLFSDIRQKYFTLIFFRGHMRASMGPKSISMTMWHPIGSILPVWQQATPPRSPYPAIHDRDRVWIFGIFMISVIIFYKKSQKYQDGCKISM